MSSKLRLCACFLLLGTACQAACSSITSRQLGLYNDADLDASILEAAKIEVAWLLRSICTTISWVPCSPVRTPTDPPCRLPPNAGELHILRRPVTDDSPTSSLGFTMLSRGSPGKAAVFLSRIRDTLSANPGTIGFAPLLGHVMAHETGHLLLQSPDHTREGLMRAGFRREDLILASKRRLVFTPNQALAVNTRRLVRRTD
jgi:hypothetical protein